MAEFGQLIERWFLDEELAASLAAYRPEPNDVIISPFGQCGTTWLQQTFHTLRTRGDMDFDDISAVVPWIETASALKIDINAPQRALPRGFKSHLPYDQIPKGARYVISFRDPKDAIVSTHRFMEGWFLEPGAVPISDFAEGWNSNPRAQTGIWWHLLTWWEQRKNPRVLLFSYEEMIDDPEATVVRLARFCGIPLDDALLRLTLEHSSINFMLEHKDKFADGMMRALAERQCNLPPGGDSAKVRKGGVGGHRDRISAETTAMLDAAWNEVVRPATGFADYAAFEAAVRAER
ncbi:MAG TPA: sulfotransferase domain-containing protein [Polyangiaceae bacterium]